MQLVYSVPLLVTGAAAIVLMAYVWKRRTVPAAAPLLGLLCSLAFWCIPCAFEPHSSTVSARLLWMRLELPAITCLSGFYLLVSLEYTGFRLRRQVCAAVVVVPATLQIAAWTHSQWYWRRIWIDTSSPLHLTGVDWGPGFWCFVVYSWAVTVSAIFLIVRQLVRARGPRRRETAIFLASTVVPAIVNIPDCLGLTPGWPDLTPFAFGITAAGIAWVLFRFRFQAIMPVAWTTIFQGMDDGVLVLDTENRVLVTNDAAARFLNKSNEQIIGRPFDSVLGACAPLRRLTEGSENECDIEFGSGNDKRTCEVRVSSLRDKRDQVIGRVLSIRDVTAVRAAARELNEAKMAAEVASRAKSQFLANMSHEIRTPMNGVLGMIDVALETGGAPEGREYLVMARHSAEALLTVINDILDFSKIEANRLELDQVHFDLADCLEDTLKSFSLAAAEKEIELICEIGPDVPVVVRGDQNRLRQVITNLVGNALKFTRQGEVCLCVACDDEERDDRGRLHFTISDTGIGIPVDKQRLIFDAFAQGDSSIARSYGGTGLGLTISAHLVSLMGGTIWVRSEPGNGSEFHFTVTLEPVAEQPPHPRPTGIPSGIKVLLVDDNGAARRVLGNTLRSWGMPTTVTSDGPSALTSLAKANGEGQPFRLVLVDGRMPEMDGFAVAQRVRQCPEFGHPLVVLLGGCGRAGDIERGRESGVAAFVNKPVSRRDLAGTLGSILRQESTNEHAAKIPQESARQTAAALRILLAEDNRINQLLAKKLLERRGHVLTVANNGREALDLFAAGVFDLVLMDVQMPEMDGFETTAAIRSREALTGGHVPIIALTANAMSGDRERCMEAGMDSYLAKPLRPEEFFAAIDAIGAPQTS